MKSIFKQNPERMRLKGDLDGLLRLLDDKNDNSLRKDAILALGRMKTPVAVDEMIRLYEEGMTLVKGCEHQLDAYEAVITRLGEAAGGKDDAE